MPTSMRASCFSRRNGFSTSWREAELFLPNVDAHVVAPGRHGQADFEAPVDRVGGLSRNICASRSSSGPPKRVSETRRAVDAHLQVVRSLGAAHHVDRVAPELRPDHVLAVDREIVADEEPAARTERQALDVIGLRAIRGTR